MEGFLEEASKPVGNMIWYRGSKRTVSCSRERAPWGLKKGEAERKGGGTEGVGCIPTDTFSSASEWCRYPWDWPALVTIALSWQLGGQLVPWVGSAVHIAPAMYYVVRPLLAATVPALPCL